MNDFIYWLNHSLIGYASPLEIVVTPFVLLAWLVATYLWIEAYRDRAANDAEWRRIREHAPVEAQLAYARRDAVADEAINAARSRWFAKLFLLLLCTVASVTPDGVRQQVRLFFLLYELFAVVVTAVLVHAALYSFASRRRLGSLIRSKAGRADGRQSG